MKKFDVTISFEITGRNSFGAESVSVMSHTKTVNAIDKASAEMGLDTEYTQQGKKVVDVSACEVTRERDPQRFA